MVHLHEMKQIAKKKESHSRIAGTQQTNKLWTWCKRFIFGRVKHLSIAFPTHSCSARHTNSMIQYVWGKKEQCGQELVQLLATELKHEGWERMNKNKYLFYSTYERAHNPLQTTLKIRFERRPQSSHGISLRLWNLRHSQNIAMVQKIKSWHQLQYSFVRGLKHLCYLFFGHVHVRFPKVPRCQAMPQNPGSNLIQAPHWQHGNGAKTCAALRSAQPRCPTLETIFVQVPLSSPHQRHLATMFVDEHLRFPVSRDSGGTGKDVAGVNTWHLWNHRPLLELQWEQESVIFRECYAV